MRLRDLREDNDLTQATVAKYLHCAQNTYHQYESGKRQIPLNLLEKLGLTDDNKTYETPKMKA